MPVHVVRNRVVLIFLKSVPLLFSYDVICVFTSSVKRHCYVTFSLHSYILTLFLCKFLPLMRFLCVACYLAH